MLVDRHEFIKRNKKAHHHELQRWSLASLLLFFDGRRHSGKVPFISFEKDTIATQVAQSRSDSNLLPLTDPVTGFFFSRWPDVAPTPSLP